MDIKAKFEEKLSEKIQGKADNAVIQTQAQIQKILQDLLRIQSVGAKSIYDFNVKQRFEVLHVGDCDRLIRHRHG